MEALLRAQETIDLHLHSTHSDGTDTPAEVVRAAHAHGVRTLALTDHDTASGWDEAAAECAKLGLSFIPGMEFSARRELNGQRVAGIHLLAYLCDPHDVALRRETDRIVRERTERGRQIVERLASDYPMNFEDVLAHAQGGTVGRPHIASTMIDYGYISAVDEFFSLVTKRSPYYVPSPSVPILDAIALVRGAGGVPIIAHPCGRTEGIMPREVVLELTDAGLAGFELDHWEHQHADKASAVATLRAYAEEFDLIVTGSSDYHGTRKPNRPGDFSTSPEMLERILEQGTGVAPHFPV
jgi:predicted metal-dependent phosphoesterase TrpH